MIKLHHLNRSRSLRILWLLEELGVEYEAIRYERDQKPTSPHPNSSTCTPSANPPCWKSTAAWSSNPPPLSKRFARVTANT